MFVNKTGIMKYLGLCMFFLVLFSKLDNTVGESSDLLTYTQMWHRSLHKRETLKLICSLVNLLVHDFAEQVMMGNDDGSKSGIHAVLLCSNNLKEASMHF